MQECNRRQEGKEIRCWAPKLLSSRIISQDSSDDWNEETLTFAGHLSDENSDDLWIIMFSGRSSLVQQLFQPLPYNKRRQLNADDLSLSLFCCLFPTTV